MSTAPPPRDPSDDADESYRRASERDTSRPSEETRRAVLGHAARLAAERGRRREGRRRWLSLAGLAPGWRPALAGTLAVAALAGVVIAPQFMAPDTPPVSQVSPSAHEELAPPPPASVAPAPPAAPVEKTTPAVVTASRVPQRQVTSAQRAAESAAPPPAAPAGDTAAGGALQEPAQVNMSAKEDAAHAMNQAAAAARYAPNAPGAPSVSSPGLLGGYQAPPADPAALRRAAAAGDLSALNAQLDRGSAVDAPDAEGRTALLLAALNGQADAVAVLLAHGADPSATDAHGMTPLQAAIAGDERQIIVTLRRYGAR